MNYGPGEVGIFLTDPAGNTTLWTVPGSGEWGQQQGRPVATYYGGIRGRAMDAAVLERLDSHIVPDYRLKIYGNCARVLRSLARTAASLAAATLATASVFCRRR